jgi:hypothetical protein
MPTKKATLASSKTRVQGVSTVQVVKSTAGLLRRIIVANSNAAVQTLTVTDGSTDQGVYSIPPNDTRVLEFGVAFATSIKVTPSHANIDALVVFD